MAYEPQLIKCEGCGVRISMRGDSLVFTGAPNEKQSRSGSQGALIEGSCPKCGDPFEIWYTTDLRATHLVDLEIDRPEAFVGRVRARVDELANDRAERKRAQEESQLRSKKRREAQVQARQEADQRKLEERQRQVEARRVEQVGDDGDWGDEGDGGRSSNDDRSDSMNPNNDAYQDSIDNRSDQMNPNNDSYRS